MPLVSCVGAIITGAGGAVLLVQRGHAPEVGRWSLPGGRVEAGETDEQALVREVWEETGLRVAAGPLVGAVRRPTAGPSTLDIRDYAATVTGGELAAGDDAASVAWVSPAELAGLPLTTGLVEALRAWGVIPVPPPALVAEAMRRAGLIWLTVPGEPRPWPAWHVWDGTAAYVVTGPGEQPLPGLASGCSVRVTVPSKDSGGALVRWIASAERIEPGSPGWEAAAGRLAAARLNARVTAADDSLAQQWARAGAVFRLVPE